MVDLLSFESEELGNSNHLGIRPKLRETATIDPVWDVGQYRATSEQRGLPLIFVLETRVKTPSVSGARGLAESVGTEVGASPLEQVGSTSLDVVADGVESQAVQAMES